MATAKAHKPFLRYAADWRPLLTTAVYFTALSAAIFSPPKSAGLGLGLFVLLCVTSFQGAVQTHNAIHRPVFLGRRWNKFYQVVLTLSYGHPVSAFVAGHNLGHHKHTQSQKDVLRTTKARFRLHLLNGLLFPALVAPGLLRGDIAYARAMRRRLPRWYGQLLLELSALVVVQLAVFIVNWKAALLFWFIPHMIAQWGIVAMNLLQHDGCDETHPHNHSRNFMSPVLNWWMFNNGYHTVHHQNPNLHWSLLPEAHKEHVAGKIHPALEQRSLAAYAIKTFLLGRRQRYDGGAVVLHPPGPDEHWLPSPDSTARDLGAEQYS